MAKCINDVLMSFIKNPPFDIIIFSNYIANYNPSERYAFGAPVVDEGERVLNLENEYVMDGTSVALEGVVYADVRNRTFVI